MKGSIVSMTRVLSSVVYMQTREGHCLHVSLPGLSCECIPGHYREVGVSASECLPCPNNTVSDLLPVSGT